MTTIYDVARRAGVSPATVSRVFNGVRVTPERESSVLRAAEELGFVPNRNARRLRTRVSEIIAMMIPDIENPFYTSMTRGVEDVARAAGYAVMLCNTDDEPERETAYLRVAVSEPVAGIICTPASASSSLDDAVTRGVPMVCVDRTAPDHDLDSVVVDNAAGASRGTELLYQAGFQRVACVTGPVHLETADQRARGWADAVLASTGRPANPDYLVRVAYAVEGGEDAMRALLDLPDPPDAVFAANNKLAIGAMRALHARDSSPPRVGVVAFGELPPLVGMPRGVVVGSLPSREIGVTAATMLLERIRGLDTPGRQVVLPCGWPLDREIDFCKAAAHPR